MSVNNSYIKFKNILVIILYSCNFTVDYWSGSCRVCRTCSSTLVSIWDTSICLNINITINYQLLWVVGHILHKDMYLLLLVIWTITYPVVCFCTCMHLWCVLWYSHTILRFCILLYYKLSTYILVLYCVHSCDA